MSRGVRFNAVIRKTGSNPYVEVPDRVSRALSAHRTAGYIRVAGRLNRTPLRGTFVPQGGRYVMYVNGGMRAAAGVGVGDRIQLDLQALSSKAVAVPADLSTALRHVEGAPSAFAALPVSHRRELLRYIDDARTPQGRRRRIDRVVADSVGRSSKPTRRSESAADRPMWTCPKCGHEFVNRNQFHSCRRYDLSDLFRAKPHEVRALFDRFREMVQACGPVKMQAYRDKVAFMVRVRFAGAIPRKRSLDIGFWLTRRIDDRRFARVETLGPDAHIYRVRIARPEQLDRQLAGWIQEAYGVGQQRHLRNAQR